MIYQYILLKRKKCFIPDGCNQVPEINIVFKQGCIKFIKSDIKDIFI